MFWSKNLLSIGFGLVIGPLLLMQLYVPQMEISILVNGINQLWVDKLCLYGTLLGDGFFVIIASIILFFFQPRIAIVLLLSYALSSGITQGLKHLVFHDLHRPLWHLEKMNLNLYHIISGAEITYNQSFPSGHTTTAFAFYISLALFVKGKHFQLLLLLLAFFIAFTRIYLLQHFLIDTCVGAIIGFVTAQLVFNLVYKKELLTTLFLKINR
jgi:membrane-associated phospholipid phosphatase